MASIAPSTASAVTFFSFSLAPEEEEEEEEEEGEVSAGTSSPRAGRASPVEEAHRTVKKGHYIILVLVFSPYAPQLEVLYPWLLQWCKDTAYKQLRELRLPPPAVEEVALLPPPPLPRKNVKPGEEEEEEAEAPICVDALKEAAGATAMAPDVLLAARMKCEARARGAAVARPRRAGRGRGATRAEGVPVVVVVVAKIFSEEEEEEEEEVHTAGDASRRSEHADIIVYCGRGARGASKHAKEELLCGASLLWCVCVWCAHPLE